ncbi:hypothetical protein BH20ACT24_BH20ACT24_13040 [soil metagenome]
MPTIPEPSFMQVLTEWRLRPETALPLLLMGWMYLRGVRRVNHVPGRSPWPRHRTAAFVGGVALLFLALQSPLDAFADTFLWVHMVQHLLLTMVSAPLLLLGAPVTLALRASGPATRRRVMAAISSAPARALGNPIVAWVLFAVVLVGSHFSPLYEAALERPLVHGIEHALYVGSALIFWWPVLSPDPGRRRLSDPLRVLYLFLAGPVNTITALAIYSSAAVLYPHYAAVRRTWGPTPLADQALAGGLMWVVGDGLLLTWVGIVVAVWMRRDRAMVERREAREAAAAAPPVGEA